ncbi:MAG: multidrug resistance protein MATE [Prolixibacteraceae bacterium]|nr:MAG: multidrug resistance protein MATE [Prolixibacteraceae bacterium]
MKLAEYFPFYKRSLHLALPVVISQIGQVSVMLVDNMMVGYVGTTELAASAFANNVFMVGMFFGMGITFGLTPLTGNSFGNGKINEVVIWLKNGIFTHLAAGFGLNLIMAGIYFLLPYLGQTPDVVKLAKPYFLLLCLSYLPFMLFFSLKQFFEGTGNTKIAMHITISANIINVVFNYLLIFGKFGFPEMGLNGAGAGTLISRVAMPLMFFIYIIKTPVFKGYFVQAHQQLFDRQKIIRLLKIGIPIAFQITIEGIAFSIGAIMMGWLGEVQLAAHQVAIGLASYTIRVSHQMGVKDYKALKMAAFASTHLVLVFMSIMGIVFVIARNLLPFLFTDDTEVIKIAAGLLIIAAIFQVFDGLQVVMLSTLRGMADVKLPMFIAFFAYLALGIPASYLLAFQIGLGPQGIWYGYLVGLGAAGILFWLRFQHNLKKKA